MSRSVRKRCSQFRQCLGCGRNFASEGPSNRFCAACNERNSKVGRTIKGGKL